MLELERVLNAKEKKFKKNTLSSIILYFKNFFKKRFKFFFQFKEFQKKNKTFEGWGLITTDTIPPWKNEINPDVKKFNKSLDQLKDLVREKKFNLTQFDYHDTDYNKIIDELSWRHYLVFNSILMANQNSKSKIMNIAEFGVCDGLTIFFALHACKYKNLDYKAYLYDTWKELDEKNEKLRFKYSYLDIEKTKNNLSNFKENVIFNQGLIPDTFEESENPNDLSWIHIDLNSSTATLATLNFFYNKLISGGIVLFDDYGGFTETQKVIDNFFLGKDGHFLNLPTGQGIFIKN